MSLAVVYGRAAVGIEAPLVTVEVHLAGGLPSLSVVGLAEAAVRESKDRVRSAIVNSGFDFPRRRITVNLAPADLPKHGGRFDLPIAVGILAASGQLRTEQLASCEFAGELALTGLLRPTGCALPMAVHTGRHQRQLILPETDAIEAALAASGRVHPARTLLEVCGHLNGDAPLPAAQPVTAVPPAGAADLAEVRGQEQARRALEIAAAGGHSLLLSGPPGTGKSMLASRLTGILPPMTTAESLETAAVHSVAQDGFNAGAWGRRPFRAPHHSASHIALIGGGSRPQPGEISLAHNGVLFLDELPEFSRGALEVLREPLETRQVVISRAAAKVTYPASFQLVAAMNPCPCGHLGDPMGECRCTPDRIARYRSRLSGPLLDRIDLFMEVPRLTTAELRRGGAGEPSATVRQRTVAARNRQLARDGVPAAHLGPDRIETVCALGDAEQTLLDEALDRFGLSARGYHRCLRVARTIADLAGSETVRTPHLAEAISYRRWVGHQPHRTAGMKSC